MSFLLIEIGLGQVKLLQVSQIVKRNVEDLKGMLHQVQKSKNTPPSKVKSPHKKRHHQRVSSKHVILPKKSSEVSITSQCANYLQVSLKGGTILYIQRLSTPLKCQPRSFEIYEEIGQRKNGHEGRRIGLLVQRTKEEKI